ncbi:MAG: hypothetical protein KDF54_03800 [Hydrogenophaga sp.]|nr:hypothetical protein [Hydrogenophaga sp.]
MANCSTNACCRAEGDFVVVVVVEPVVGSVVGSVVGEVVDVVVVGLVPDVVEWVIEPARWVASAVPMPTMATSATSP